MNITKLKRITYFTVITLMITFSTTARAQVGAYQISDRQVQNLLDRLEKRTNIFKSEIDNAPDNREVSGTFRDDSIN